MAISLVSQTFPRKTSRRKLRKICRQRKKNRHITLILLWKKENWKEGPMHSKSLKKKRLNLKLLLLNSLRIQKMKIIWPLPGKKSPLSGLQPL